MNTNQPYNHYESYTDVVYRLTGWEIADPEEATYPCFEVCIKEEILFRTLSDAEAKLQELANDGYDGRYSFEIDEIPIGVHCPVGWSQSTRSYTADGKLNAVSGVSNMPDRNGHLEIFWGREADSYQFKPGDIVEVKRGDSVALEIICSVPVDREWALRSLPKEYPAEGIKVHLDWSDDGYTTLCSDNGFMESHSHPPIVDCFPAISLPMNKSCKAKLQKAYSEFVRQGSC